MQPPESLLSEQDDGVDSLVTQVQPAGLRSCQPALHPDRARCLEDASAADSWQTFHYRCGGGGGGGWGWEAGHTVISTD